MISMMFSIFEMLELFEFWYIMQRAGARYIEYLREACHREVPLMATLTHVSRQELEGGVGD